MMLNQSLINLGKKDNYQQKNFVVGDHNKDSFNFVKKFSANSQKFIAFIGEEGSGKTHLLHIFAEQQNGRWINKKDFDYHPRDLVADTRMLYVLDDADFCYDEIWLFDFYNIILEKKVAWAISAKKPLEKWSIKLPDWYSRLQTFLVFKMTLPDDNTISKILQKSLHDRGIKIEEQVLKYITYRIERSFFGIHQMVEKIDYISAQNQRKVTIPLLKHLL
jgi:chromosomal replication initiation ATPase DnaA